MYSHLATRLLAGHNVQNADVTENYSSIEPCCNTKLS